MAYAILRTAKLKTPANVSASASHIERTRPTHNANPSISNEWLTPDGPGMFKRAQEVWDKIPKKRKDAVHAFEVLMTASPEAFDDDFDLDAWKKQSMDWLRQQFKGCTLVGACLHLDESTPHIQAILIPTDTKKDGSLQLNCKKYLGSAQKLSAMQTSYAKAVENLGLERGLQGSKAKHVTIAQFYSSISKGAPIKFKPFSVPTPPSMLRGSAREAWANAQTSALKKDLAKPINALRGEAARSKDMAKRNTDLKRSNSALSADLADTKRKLREQSDKLRQLPLTEIAEQLGCYRPKNAKDKGLWMTPAGKVFIKDDVKFINHDAQEKGGGAIDFVKHIRDCDFKEAIAWLSDIYGTDTAIESAATAARLRAQEALKNAVAKPFALPEVVERTWPKVRDYLTATRGLAVSLVEKLKRAGWLYSDKRNNVVFVQSDANSNAVAYELRGTTDTPFKHAQGNSKAGVFFVDGGFKRLAVCESSIDAISYVQIHPDCSAVAVAGTGKYEAAIPFIEKHGKKYGEIVCASDNDLAGEAMAMNLNLQWTPPPRSGADWNEFLLDPTPDPDPTPEPLKKAKKHFENAPGLGS